MVELVVRIRLVVDRTAAGRIAVDLLGKHLEDIEGFALGSRRWMPSCVFLV